MASKNCVSCLRAIQRQQARSIPSAQKIASKFGPSREFATSANRYAENLQSNATPATSIPPATGRAKRSPTSIAELLRKATPNATETYTAFGATELLYKECAHQADYTIPQAGNDEEEMPKTEDGEDIGVGDGWWHNELGLKPTFSTWSQVTMLHMYLFSVRFRCFEAHTAQPWQQHLLDHFFYDAENKMVINHNMHARGTRSKYLKDMYLQWRGLLAAYDEGLAKGDAVLAGAIWRNLFKGNEDVDIKALGQIVSFMRRSLHGLDKLPDDTFGTYAMDIKFGTPQDETSVVRLPSPMMNLSFESAPGTSSDGKIPPGGNSFPVKNAGKRGKK